MKIKDKDIHCLDFIYKRMINIHEEHARLDFMADFEGVIDKLRAMWIDDKKKKLKKHKKIIK